MNKAKNCVINCIDFRIQEAFFEWLEKTHNLGKSDIIEIAGSSRDLVKPLNFESKEELLRNIELSISLHNPDTIIVVDHQDCGGYAQDNTIPSGISEEEDRDYHKNYLKEAKEILQTIYPTKIIKGFYASLSGNIVQLV